MSSIAFNLSAFFGYIAAVAIGFILGVLGGGGSILSVPIMVYLFNLDAVTASGYSLFIVGITSLTGAVPKYRDHLVDLKSAMGFGVPSIIMTFSTRKWILPAIPDQLIEVYGYPISKRLLLLGLFAILMVAASFTMIRGRNQVGSSKHRHEMIFLALEGSVIGFLSGLIGAGGGFLIIPALVFITGLPFKTAVGTSLFIIGINSLSGFLGDVLNYQIQWPFLLTITSLAVIGIFIGDQFSKKLDANNLRILFGWFTLCIGVFILYKELFVTH